MKMFNMVFYKSYFCIPTKGKHIGIDRIKVNTFEHRKTTPNFSDKFVRKYANLNSENPQIYF